MRSTVLLRLALAALGFALGLGVALAARWRPPPDLAQPVCPDCRSPNGWRIGYQPLQTDPSKVIAVGQYGTVVGTYPADPRSPIPRPLDGPLFQCTKCQALWGPPAFHKKGNPRRRNW